MQVIYAGHLIFLYQLIVENYGDLGVTLECIIAGSGNKLNDKIMGKLLQKKDLEDQRVDGRIILRWILVKCNDQALSKPD
jgi:hypothetical protein